MIQYGDICKIKGAELPEVDVVTGGSPCQDLSLAGARAGLDGERSGLFMEQVRVIKEMRKHDQEVNGHTGEDIRPRYMVWENVCVTGDTLVTTLKGLKEIKDIEESEYVKTLSGKYMPVLKKHITENQDVVKVHFSGGEDLIVTPNHPFYARKKVDKIKKGKRVITYTDPEWIPAIELTNKHMLASVLDIPTMDVKLDADTLWLVGRYIALGSVSTNRSNPRIYLSYGRCGFEKTKEILSKTAYKFYENKSYKNSRYTFTSADFYFYIKNAGSGVGNKRIPSYIFELPLPLQKCVLDGFLSSNKDFSEGKPTITITTASRLLAHSLVQLIKNVYETSANIVVIDKDKLNSQDKVIQGHKITHNHSSYKVIFSLSNKKSDFVEDDLLWIPVKKVETLENKETVYNLSVSEDNTYVANGIIVHNCGAFSSNGGKDFRVVLEETAKIADESAVIPRLKEKERWTTAGSILGEGYSLAWRVHDAQYWGVPQRRKRICLLADFNGDTAGRLLFDLECKRKTDDSESDKIN